MHFNPTLKLLESVICIHDQSNELGLFTVGRRIINVGPVKSFIKTLSKWSECHQIHADYPWTSLQIM